MANEQRGKIYMNLKGVNRSSFKVGIISLLNHCRVRYDDLFNDLQIVVDLRNKITHEGNIHRQTRT